MNGGTYPWGAHEPDGTQSVFAQPPSDLPPTFPVKSFPANGYGLYEMAGNVWQWCADWYADDYYATSSRQNPQGPATGICRVRRGASWNVIQSFRLRCANRGAMEPAKATPNLGFRCAGSHAASSRQPQLLEPGDIQPSQIEAVLESVRPAMEADGGGVEFVSYVDGVVNVKLKGSCLLCPSAALTMKLGLERTLKQRLPRIQEVRRIADENG